MATAGRSARRAKCRSGEEGETLHVGTNGACSSCWFFWLPKPLGVMGDYIAYNKGCMGKFFPTFPYEMDSWVDDLSSNNVKECATAQVARHWTAFFSS